MKLNLLLEDDKKSVIDKISISRAKEKQKESSLKQIFDQDMLDKLTPTEKTQLGQLPPEDLRKLTKLTVEKLRGWMAANPSKFESPSTKPGKSGKPKGLDIKDYGKPDWGRKWSTIDEYTNSMEVFNEHQEILKELTQRHESLKSWYNSHKNLLDASQIDAWGDADTDWRQRINRIETFIENIRDSEFIIEQILQFKDAKSSDSETQSFIADRSNASVLNVAGIHNEKALYDNVRSLLEKRAKSIETNVGMINNNIPRKAISKQSNIRMTSEVRTKKDEEGDTEHSIQEKYNKYLAWAFGGGKLQNIPPGLDTDIKNARQFMSSKSDANIVVKNGQVSESKNDIAAVASWRKPAAYTNDLNPNDFRDEIGDNTTLGFILVPKGMGGGTIWYNLWNNANSYKSAKNHKEWPKWRKMIQKGDNRKRVNVLKDMVVRGPYNYKSESITASILTMLEAKKAMHPSIYYFLMALLLGYSKDAAVRVADAYIQEKDAEKKELFNDSIESDEEFSFWSNIKDNLEYRYKLVRGRKPKTAGVIARLIRHLKNMMYIEDDLESLAFASDEFHESILKERFCEKYNISNEEINILLESIR